MDENRKNTIEVAMTEDDWMELLHDVYKRQGGRW